jgi:fructose-bisphosphate aldolase class II
MMKLTVWLLTVAHCAAFSPAVRRSPPSSRSAVVLGATTEQKKAATKRREGGVADELGIPCEGECEITGYPNLPESVHPGVLSGQALLDLLQDAKTKGTSCCDGF